MRRMAVGCSRGVLSVVAASLACLAAPVSVSAAAWVKSVEYVEITLADTVTTSSTNLTKSQNTASCVPFASEMAAGTDDQYERSFTDLFFQTGPTRVTAQRDEGVGTVTLGVFVVEFDPAYVNVQPGTFAIGNASTASTSPINPVTLTKAALVFYHRQSSFLFYSDLTVAGWFSAANQLSWQRSSGNASINGHYYVFEAKNSEFSVQAVSFGIADAVSSNSAPITAVDLAKTFVIASHRAESGNNDNDDSQIGVFLSNATTLTAQRQWQSAPPPPNNTITDIRAFVVTVSDGVTVQRGTLSYAAVDLQQTAAITAVNTSASMVWNGSVMGPGTIESQAETSTFIDTAFQKLKLASATSVQGNRGENCAGACAGVGYFEVIDWATATAVTLTSFTAKGQDSAVELFWETASELNNLGFHLDRATSEEGPYERITPSPIPGLGSSPAGARYSYLDSGLTNGATYFYRLEDIETTGKTELHGPVAATPRPETAPESTTSSESGRVAYEDPDAVRLEAARPNADEMVLELRTGGFYAESQGDGSARLSVPGFTEVGAPGWPALPVRRSWVEGLAGRKVRVISVEARDVLFFAGLRPQAIDSPEVYATARGLVRATARRQKEGKGFLEAGLYPEKWARAVSIGYQGEDKKALLELAPLRWNRSTGELVLARRLLVRLKFTGRDTSELSLGGSRGRRPQRAAGSLVRRVGARLVVREKGLYRVSFEEVFGARRGGVEASALRLSHQGSGVRFHLEPQGGVFGPGSRLYFVSEGASLNPYGKEAMYELELDGEGWAMPELGSAPAGSAVTFYQESLLEEQNRYYQAGLLEAPDLWLWDVLLAPVNKSYAFEVRRLAPTTEPAKLDLWLQGTSDFEVDPDHHVRAYVNGQLLAEDFWNGKQSRRLEVDLPVGVLREGVNALAIENVGDTRATYSMVMLDKFAVTYPRLAIAQDGKLRGTWSESGTAEVAELGSTSYVLDVSEEPARWLMGMENSGAKLRFHAEAGRSYLVVSEEAVLRPAVEKALTSRLRNTRNRYDYLVVGPRSFIDAAQPLLELRRSQGLSVLAVPIDEVFAEFGYGESRPEAVRDFLSYAYHHWRTPSPRYVLLLGDATYDFKDYLGTGVQNQVPPLMIKTSYLWTASDPTYGAVNGDDPLPDLAIGRLPAATVDELRSMVEKILAYEASGPHLDGPVVLVADNPDGAGDFHADADALASSVLAGRNPRKIYLGQLDTETTRSEIVEAFDQGASLMSFLGHGGIQLWAHEDILDNARVASLAAQPRQPLLLTLNCLNGYFHFPYFNSLAEELLKTKGRGALAAFSPSGLSLNGPAQLYHRMVLLELVNPARLRLGDALLAAQAAYAETGAFPELLSIYHLLGDPALRLR